MSVTSADILFKKPVTINDTTTNGGVKGQVEVVSGVRHSLFPRVTKSERTAGTTKYRKEFWCNENESEDIAYGVLVWIELPSNADDRFYLTKGTQTDTQTLLTTPATGDVVLWGGCGQLHTALSGAETSIVLDMENNDFVFNNGDYLHISNKLLVSQTIGSTVVAGDSVLLTTGTWNKITSTTDIDYPNGLYVGDNNVLTLETTTNEEWLKIAENLTEDESIGTGDGSDTSPTLSTLTNVTKGICNVSGKTPVISTINTSDGAMTVTLNQDGTFTGDASAGELNMTTGAWTTPIVWTSAPKLSADITCTYREKPYSYSSNTVTVELDTGESVSNAYTVAKTFASICVYEEVVVASFDTDSWAITSAAGAYDNSNLTIHNDGAEEDTITLTFNGTTTYTASGINSGNLNSGSSLSVSTNPVILLNPSNGKSMVTIPSAGWSGSWVSGDTIVFDTHPGAVPIWLKEVVPAATVQESNNVLALGWYCE